MECNGPTKENFDAFLTFLMQHNVDVHVVKKCLDNEEEANCEIDGFGMRNSVSELSIFEGIIQTNTKMYQRKNSRKDQCRNRVYLSNDLKEKINKLEIPKNEKVILAFQNQALEPESESEFLFSALLNLKGGITTPIKVVLRIQPKLELSRMNIIRLL